MKLRGYICISLFAVALASASCKGGKQAPEEAAEPVMPEPEYRWGICVDDYDIEDGVIGNGQVLSGILGKYGVGQQKVYQIDKESADVFSVRKLRAGNSYHVLQTRDTLHRADWFVYDISALEHAVYSLQDSFVCYIDTIPADTVQRHVTGKITSSLWNAMIESGAPIDLTGLLADMYSWTIDFFGVQVNDSFSVFYQDIMVDDTVRVASGRILASNFITGGSDHYAFYYKDRKGERSGYFDDKGNSLRRAFLKAPLSYTRISSTFSNARLHPVYKVYRPHHGVDYAAPTGTPIMSIGDGTVITRGWDKGGGGNYIKVKHNATYTTVYMHMSKFASGINVGTHVKQGQVIGYVGATGTATGPHLDFRVYKNGTPINPLSMDLPAEDPLSKEDMPAYLEAIAPYMKLIGMQSDSIVAAPDTLQNNN